MAGQGVGVHLTSSELISLNAVGNIDVTLQLTGAGAVEAAAGGAISLSSIGGIGLVIDGIGVSGVGVTLIANSPLTISAPVDGGGGLLILAAEGNLATDILTIEAAVTNTNAAIELYAGHDIVIAAGGSVTTTTSGNVSLFADTDYNGGGGLLGGSGTGAIENPGNGLITSAGAIVLEAATGIGAGANPVLTAGASITADNSGTGDVFITHTGALTLTLTAADGSATVVGDSTIATGGAISVTTGNFLLTATDLTIGHAVSATGTITITSAADGALSVGSGAGLVIDAAELANLTATSVVLQTTGPGQLNIAAADASATSGYVLTLRTTGSGDIVQTGSFQFGGAVAIDSVDAYTIDGSNLRALGWITVDAVGGVTATGAVQFLTTDDNITFNSNVTIDTAASSATFDSTDGNNTTGTGSVVSIQGIDGTAANTNDLTLISGQGTTLVNGAIVNVGTLTIQRNAASSTGTVTFDGSVGAETVTTFGQAHAIVLNAGASVTNAMTFNNTGALTLGGAATYTFTNGVTATAPSAVTLDGTVQTTNSAIDFGAASVVLAGNTTLSAGTALITLGAVTVSGGDQNLILQGSGGATITSANLGTTSGTLDLTGMTAGTVALTGSLTAFDLTTAANTLAVSLNGGSVASDVAFLNSGTLTIGASGFTFTGGLTATAGSANLGGNVSTTDTNMTFAAINLTAPVTLTTGAGTLGTGAVTATGDQNLSVSNATGSAGASFASLALNAGDLILSGVTDGTVTVTGAITAGTVTTGTGAYNLVFTGGGTLSEPTIFGAISSVSIGANFMFEAGVTATAPPVTITNNVRIQAFDTFNIALGAITINNGFTLTLGSAGAVDNDITTGTVNGQAGGFSNLSINTLGSVALGAVGTGNDGVADLTVVTGAAFSLPAVDITGNLVVNAVGITQSGALLVDGTSSFTGNAGVITLTNAAN
ncbi:MAG: hypothetical protein LC632_09455, partial [Xanthomonadaceae bacterium]|nr:hypothetical protein [Xanthomonadaceae bacterium]